MNNSSKLISLVKLPVIKDDCNLAVAQNNDLPFAIKRLYYIYHPTEQLSRGFHAHHATKQILFCLNGKVKMILDNGQSRESIVLTDPREGLMIEPMVWHEMHDMDASTILLVLASKEYDEADYIRNHEQFIQLIKHTNNENPIK